MSDRGRLLFLLVLMLLPGGRGARENASAEEPPPVPRLFIYIPGSANEYEYLQSAVERMFTNAIGSASPARYRIYPAAQKDQDRLVLDHLENAVYPVAQQVIVEIILQSSDDATLHEWVHAGRYPEEISHQMNRAAETVRQVVSHFKGVRPTGVVVGLGVCAGSEVLTRALVGGWSGFDRMLFFAPSFHDVPAFDDLLARSGYDGDRVAVFTLLDKHAAVAPIPREQWRSGTHFTLYEDQGPAGNIL